MARAATETVGTSDHPNVILISLDTARPDHLSCYGYVRQTTPNIDRIAKEGTVFTQAFSQAPNTFPSHLSLLTSRYPQKSWITEERGELESSIQTLAETFKHQGYTTGAFVGFDNSSDRLIRLLTSRPLLTFDRVSQGTQLKSLPGALFQWLIENRDKPFFLFLHGFDAHDPHVLPIKYDAKRFNPSYEGKLPSTTLDLKHAMALSPYETQQLATEQEFSIQRETYLKALGVPDQVRPEDVEHMKAVYDAQIYHLDDGLGQLFVALENLHLMERTLIVIVSDHGEAFGEHGKYSEHSELYDEITHMVLIVRNPRLQRQEKKVDKIVQGIDVMPTILELVDLPVPESAQGRSFVSLLQTGQTKGWEEIAVSAWQGMRAIRTPSWKLIDVTGGPKSLYHLASDPKEQHTVIDQHPDIAARLQTQLDARLPASETAPTPVENPVQRMREHGYW